MNKEENLRLQKEEIDALSSIFGADWECFDDLDKVYNIVISSSSEPPKAVTLQIVFCDGYPLDGPPIYRLNAPWINREAKQNLGNQLEQLYLENIGQQVIFMWVEKIKEFLYKQDDAETDNLESSMISDDLNEEDYENSMKENAIIENSNLEFEADEVYELPEILHGEPLCDRKSTFQAHLARVTSKQQVKMVLDKLLENKKIAHATHNIMAYRIVQNKNGIETIISNCDDDGETGASSRMLFLMKTLDVKNVMVVVSRWWGGVFLHQDRFRHINNCCREILINNGIIDSKQKSPIKKKK